MAGLLVLGRSTGLFGLLAGSDRAYSRDYRRLLDSLGPTRPIEARVSGGDPYRPYRPRSGPHPSNSVKPSSTLRGGTTLGEEMSSRLPVSPEIVRAISKADGREPSPENRAALGVLNLVVGSLKDAVQMLREANTQKPDDPRILNDLGASLLEQSEATGDPWPALEAIEMFERSIHLQLSLPALFNKALALERWGIRTRAIVAWRRYLNEDSRSPWAEEAEQRLRQLEQEVAEQQARPQLLAKPAEDVMGFPGNPWANRQLGERVVLTRWAELTLAGRTVDAEAALAQAEALAATLSLGGGRLLKASIAVIREADQSGDVARLQQLAQGHAAFGRAFLLRREEKTGAALTLLEDAIRDLQAAKTPFELRARVLRAWIVAEPDWAELRDLVRSAEENSFPSIAAEAQRIIAYRISLQGRLEAAIQAYRDAWARFDELGEREESSVIDAMLPELLDALNRQQEAASELASALKAGTWVADPWNRYSIYVVAASSAAGQFSRAAIELRLEAAEACQDLPERPLCKVDSALWIAALTPDETIAEEFLRRAGDLLPAVPDSDGKARTEIDLDAARARWLGGEDRSVDEQEEAASLYRSAAAQYDTKGRAVSAARARVAQARLLQRLGRPQESIAAYQAALNNLRLWDQSGRAEKRSPRELREVYEAIVKIDLEATGEEPSQAAFLISEEMRDRLAPRHRTKLWLPSLSDFNDFVAEVPPQSAVIEYAVVEGKVIAWILASRRLDQVVLTLPDKLEQSISSLEGERRLEAWQRTTGTLFRDLIAPVLSRLPAGTERLILIPDAVLYGLPFRALWDPKSHRYLDEIFTIELAPSVREVLGASSARSSKDARLIALSVGIPSFSPELALEPLPKADDEAAAIRSVYGRSAIESCQVTDWASFHRCAPEADVLHLATHASADSSMPEASWLAFQGETISLDRLWRELPELPRAPLVVLSACQSVATSKGGEGLSGLARPFLASGAQAVVGTLWNIGDEAAASMFPEFHRAYRGSKDAAQALREARRRWANWEERPWAWGAVEVMRAEL